MCTGIQKHISKIDIDLRNNGLCWTKRKKMSLEKMSRENNSREKKCRWWLLIKHFSFVFDVAIDLHLIYDIFADGDFFNRFFLVGFFLAFVGQINHSRYAMLFNTVDTRTKANKIIIFKSAWGLTFFRQIGSRTIFHKMSNPLPSRFGSSLRLN